MSQGEKPRIVQRANARRGAMRRMIRRLFEQIWVEIGIAVLVLLSVGLTLGELAMEISGIGLNDSRMVTMRLVNDLITLIFIGELTLRFFAATSKVRFFREFWIDILAVLPLFRVFRTWRALRLLRLIRIMRLLGVMSRLATNYPYVFRRGAMEYGAICGLLIVTVVFGTISMMYFENPNRRGLIARAKSITETRPEQRPSGQGGKAIKPLP